MRHHRFSAPDNHASAVELPLTGLRISSLRLSVYVPFVVLTLTNEQTGTDDFRVTIDAPFKVSGHRRTTPPQYDASVLSILDRIVSHGFAMASGLLSVHFDNGNQLTVEAQSDGEAWQLEGDNDYLVVSLPGGGLHQSS